MDEKNAGDVAQDPDAITWTASEYINHSKPAGWYVLVCVGAVVLAAIVYLLTRDVVSTAVIFIVGIAFAVFGARKPRELKYALSPSGLLIASRYFPLSNFRSFSVTDEGAFSSVVFVPVKRFGQAVTIYIDVNDEQKILDVLASQLPMDNRGADPVDRLMRRIRF